MCRSFLNARWAVFESKNTFECVGKSLIRWIDRSIFELFVVGLKKTKMIFEAESAGISLVLPSAPSNPLKESKEGEADVNDPKIPSGQNAHQIADSLSNASLALFKQQLLQAMGNAQWKDLSANIASLSAASLALSIKCAKCGAPSFMTCSSNCVVTAACKRCANGQSILMQSTLVHENSNIIARLEPKGCRPGTFNHIVRNLGYGVAHKTWCFSCHTKCEFYISVIRFAGNFHLIAKEDETIQKMNSISYKSKDVIQKHRDAEERSVRIYTFPCCGKLYPCDLCHDENERDHEMKFASRMVCGFCSKE
uniref:CHY-type domain-containing protein n=1 Tax=Parascaris equorum TaxID=6256 RepID=A0A914S2M8_PAREQ